MSNVEASETQQMLQFQDKVGRDVWFLTWRLPYYLLTLSYAFFQLIPSNILPSLHHPNHPTPLHSTPLHPLLSRKTLITHPPLTTLHSPPPIDQSSYLASTFSILLLYAEGVFCERGSGDVSDACFLFRMNVDGFISKLWGGVSRLRKHSSLWGKKGGGGLFLFMFKGWVGTR